MATIAKETRMLFHDALERFVQRSPFSVMVRCTLENLLRPEQLDALFAETADRQYTRQILFSSLVDLMGLVVCKIRPSMRSAYFSRKERIDATLKSVYEKLNHVEPAVVTEMVRRLYRDAAAVVDQLGGGLTEWAPGYNVRILDGNKLTGTQHRLVALRFTKQAALPGQSLVVLDARRGLVCDVLPCEDAHAQERSLLTPLLDTVRARDLWIADRNFCVARFLFSIAAKLGYFIVRHHGGSFGWNPVGERRPRGRVDTGTVFEQTIQVTYEFQTWTLRRVSLVLDNATKDGDTEIHLLTNLPPEEVDACKVAEWYRRRWTLEGVFQELTVSLQCEIDTLGYPKAALFGFGTALVAFNALSVAKAALRSVHGAEKVEETISDHQLIGEVAAVYEGMDIAVPEQVWAGFQTMPVKQLSQVLKHLASRVDLSRFRKHKRGPKKPRPKRKSGVGSTHVSTARLLNDREADTKTP
jgi:IS4 transposase